VVNGVKPRSGGCFGQAQTNCSGRFTLGRGFGFGSGGGAAGAGGSAAFGGSLGRALGGSEAFGG